MQTGLKTPKKGFLDPPRGGTPPRGGYLGGGTPGWAILHPLPKIDRWGTLLFWIGGYPKNPVLTPPLGGGGTPPPRGVKPCFWGFGVVFDPPQIGMG